MLRILPMPVAQYKIDGKDLFTSIQMQGYAIDCQEAAKEEKDLMKEVVLVTHKPKREWIGLTDEEIQSIVNKVATGTYQTSDTFARAIEAKLKEKNT